MASLFAPAVDTKVIKPSKKNERRLSRARDWGLTLAPNVDENFTAGPVLRWCSPHPPQDRARVRPQRFCDL
jgi:hypothetical protein